MGQLTQQEFTALLAKQQPALALRLLQEMIRRLRRSESAMIRDLKAKNEALAQAYEEIKAGPIRLD